MSLLLLVDKIYSSDIVCDPHNYVISAIITVTIETFFCITFQQMRTHQSHGAGAVGKTMFTL